MADKPGFRIEQIWMAVAIDPEDGEEGVPAVKVGDTMYPLVSADHERLDWVRRTARDMARESGVRMQIVRFSQRETVEEIEPQDSRVAGRQ